MGMPRAMSAAPVRLHAEYACAAARADRIAPARAHEARPRVAAFCNLTRIAHIESWPRIRFGAIFLAMSPTVILVAILGLSLLVIVHESGHYFAARAFGMKVTRFSIGFGPALVTYRPRNSPTTFQICAIPFMAYVMIAGMNPAEEVDPNDSTTYANKGVFARIITSFGGPLANYVAASLLVFGLGLAYGWPEAKAIEPMIVETVGAGSPAADAGLQPGDVVVEANGKPIRNVQQLIEVTSPRAGTPTEYVIERGGKRLPPMSITPKKAGQGGIIGVTAQRDVTQRELSLSEAGFLAVAYPFELTKHNLLGIADLIQRRTTEGITGPVGMGKIMAEQAEKGAFHFIHILIAISVALGLMNLLPFPGLDGGRLVFLGYEVITRRRPNERIEAIVHAVGVLFLLGVIALVTLRDVVG
jgi:regulator of sigma E protease